MPKILVVGNFPTTSLTGHQVLTASGYDEAIEILKTNSFDVIIMDAVIGTTDGRGLLMYILDHKQTTTIVRYHQETFYLTTHRRDWHIPSSVRAMFPFAVLVCEKHDECRRTACKAYELLQNKAA